MEEYGPKALVLMTGDSASDSLKLTRLRERHLGLSRRCYADRTKELTLRTGASVKEADSKDLTTTTGALAAEVEGMMRPWI